MDRQQLIKNLEKLKSVQKDLKGFSDYWRGDFLDLGYAAEIAETFEVSGKKAKKIRKVLERILERHYPVCHDPCDLDEEDLYRIG